MANRVVLNLKGFTELRNSPAVVKELVRVADGIALAAGEDMVQLAPETNLTAPRGRARVAVITASYDAMRAEATDRALTRALAAAGG